MAIEESGLSLPSEGRIAVFAPRVGFDIGALPRDRCDIIQTQKTDFQAYKDAGYTCVLREEGPYVAAVVALPRAKAQARDFIARAVAAAPFVVVDGQKTEAVESIFKSCRQRGDVHGNLAKSHGRVFWFSGGDFTDWLAPGRQKITNGFVTRPGVFSADGIDPASALLAAAVPVKVGRVVVDLGAGWGYLSSQIVSRKAIEILHLVEADHDALECAKLNVTDPRAQFHWEDATQFKPGSRVDTVIMNPPFHTGRKAEPNLGVAFIQAAAKMLGPAGQLWMVANRHLPYEASLKESFATVEEVGGDTRFKILHAQRPLRARG